MSKPATMTEPTQAMLARARAAAAPLALLAAAEKNALLEAMAQALAAHQDEILAANALDLANPSLVPYKRDRLLLDPKRVAALCDALRALIALPDPIGDVLEEFTRPNGLVIRKVRVPLGVLGIIYEARPNVTVDAAALALKSGNAVVLRGGREAHHTNTKIVEVLSAVPGLPAGAIELLDGTTRDTVQEMLHARGYIDVLIPRGGQELIDLVTRNSTVPYIETGAGNCHLYADAALATESDFAMADAVILNAKTQRTSVCNSAEKLLIHRAIAATYAPRVVGKLLAAGVEVRADDATIAAVKKADPALAEKLLPATAADWDTEYLAMTIAVAVVDDVDAAIAHINRHSTHHSDTILTRDEAAARRFLRGVDSACVYWNASTRFSDGAEFGFGAEMGISNQKLHARGPFALREITSYKYEVTGDGQVR